MLPGGGINRRCWGTPQDTTTAALRLPPANNLRRSWRVARTARIPGTVPSARRATGGAAVPTGAASSPAAPIRPIIIHVTAAICYLFPLRPAA